MINLLDFEVMCIFFYAKESICIPEHTIYGTFFKNRIVGNFSYLQEHVRISDNGAFNNYVDQIVPNFDPPTPSSGQKWTFYILSTVCNVTPLGISTDPHPPPLVHVVIECPC